MVEEKGWSLSRDKIKEIWGGGIVVSSSAAAAAASAK